MILTHLLLIFIENSNKINTSSYFNLSFLIKLVYICTYIFKEKRTKFYGMSRDLKSVTITDVFWVSTKGQGNLTWINSINWKQYTLMYVVCRISDITFIKLSPQFIIVLYVVKPKCDQPWLIEAEKVSFD